MLEGVELKLKRGKHSALEKEAGNGADEERWVLHIRSKRIFGKKNKKI